MSAGLPEKTFGNEKTIIRVMLALDHSARLTPRAIQISGLFETK